MGLDETALVQTVNNYNNACQSIEPHVLALNFPAALAEVHQERWERLVWSQPLARRLHALGGAITLVLVLVTALFFGLFQAFNPAEGAGFRLVGRPCTRTMCLVPSQPR